MEHDLKMLDLFIRPKEKKKTKKQAGNLYSPSFIQRITADTKSLFQQNIHHTDAKPVKGT